MPKRAAIRSFDFATDSINQVSAGFRDVKSAMAVPVITTLLGPLGAPVGGVAVAISEGEYRVSQALPNAVRRSIGLKPLKVYKRGEAFGLDVADLATTYAVSRVKREKAKKIKG